MKKLQHLLLFILISGISVPLFAQTAKVQVIHNSADPAASSVAVWVINGMNATKVANSLNFREATGYIDAPANTPIKIAISPANAISVTDTIAGLTTEVNLMQDSNYVAMATGNISAGFAPNPNNKDIGFNLLVVPSARRVASTPNNVDFTVIHGSTDAPAVDLYVRGNMTPLVNDAEYGDFTPYFSVAPQKYFVDLTPGNSTNQLQTLELDLSSALGSSLVLFASGYLQPDLNKDGEALGIYVATAGGNVIKLQTVTAKAQLIHNSADPAVANAAVWIIDGMGAMKAVDSLEFREATAYMDVPAGRDIKIAFSAAGAMSVADTIAGLTTMVNLMQDSNYVIMPTGNVGIGFAPNPDNRSERFNLIVVPRTRMAASAALSTDFIVIHGATDVPTVDLYVRGMSNPLVDNAAYGDATPYFSVAAQKYLVDLTLGNSTVPLTTLELDLSSTGGSALVLFASGYLNPGDNKNGETIGIFGATVGGNIIQLTPPTVRVQIIHNSADPALDNIDVYTESGLTTTFLLDSFELRHATKYLSLPALNPIKMSFAPVSTTSIADTLPGTGRTFTLDTGKNYVAMLMGNVTSATFESNPDGRDISFRVMLIEDVRLDANNISDADAIVVHGSTDIPAVDIVNDSNKSVLVNDIKYGDVTNYLSLMPTKYRILVQDSVNSTTIASYDLPFTNYAGRSAVIFASGYLSPANNSGGEAFGLYVALSDTVIALTQTTSIVEVDRTIEANTYPNPATTALNVEFTLTDYSPLTLEVMDNLGRVVYTENAEGIAGKNTLNINTSAFNNGMYFYTLRTKEGINTTRFVVSK